MTFLLPIIDYIISDNPPNTLEDEHCGGDAQGMGSKVRGIQTHALDSTNSQK